MAFDFFHQGFFEWQFSICKSVCELNFLDCCPSNRFFVIFSKVPKGQIVIVFLSIFKLIISFSSWLEFLQKVLNQQLSFWSNFQRESIVVCSIKDFCTLLTENTAVPLRFLFTNVSSFESYNLKTSQLKLLRWNHYQCFLYIKKFRADIFTGNVFWLITQILKKERKNNLSAHSEYRYIPGRTFSRFAVTSRWSLLTTVITPLSRQQPPIRRYRKVTS